MSVYVIFLIVVSCFIVVVVLVLKKLPRKGTRFVLFRGCLVVCNLFNAWVMRIVYYLRPPPLLPPPELLLTPPDERVEDELLRVGVLIVDERVLRVGVDIVDLRVVVERVGVLLLLMLLREGVVPMPLTVLEREVVPLLFIALLREVLMPAVPRWYTLDERVVEERLVGVALLGRPTSLLRVEVVALFMVRPVLESITLPVD